MANQKPRRKMSNQVKRTIRKTSAAVLMASAIAVAAIPAGNIEALERETNTGIKVADDKRGTYTYEITDDRPAEGGYDFKDSQSSDGTYYKKVSLNDKLATYHRKLVKNETLTEGDDYKRSYSVRKYDNDRNYYLNWQFAFDGEVLCQYNDQFLETEVELPYLVYTKFYTVSEETFKYFFESGNGSTPLNYTFKDWWDEGDRDNPQIGDGKVIAQFFPNRMAEFIKTCKDFVAACDKDKEANRAEYETLLTEEIPALERDIARLAQEVDLLDSTSEEYISKSSELSGKRQALDSKRARAQQLDDEYPYKAAEKRPVADQPSITISPSSLTAEEQYKYFCSKFVPSQDGVGDEQKSLPRINSFGGNASDYVIQMVYDMTSGSRQTVYLLKYAGDPEKLVPGVTTDSAGFLVIDYSEKGITAIGDYAFEGIGTIDVLTLHDRVKYIGDYAFANSFIKSVTIRNADVIGNAAFKNCGQLKTVTLGTAGALKTIGAEAFYGSAVESITLPYAVSDIGAGAFANCTSLKKMDLSAITAPDCSIGEAAFYNAESLESISFPPATAGSIRTMGQAALAVDYRNQPINIVLPEKMTNLPKFLFAGRTNLKSVVMPSALGVSAASVCRIPSDIFVGCSNLESVRFPEEARFVNYTDVTTYKDEEGNVLDVFPLFLDVDNPNFYVQGPAYSTGTKEALERVDTWDCITNVNNFVPYIYELNGVMYYEVSDGKYILTANEKGELLSCRARSGSSPIDLVIPAKVGNYTIQSVVDGCFSDENLRKRLRSITVEDNTLKEIQDDVFKDLPKLEWVDLGNSVETIGARAFAGCEALTDATFRADQVDLGESAFATGGDELTFHGKIASDFGPFEWAMQKDNLVKGNGVRVCYQSLSPTLLTVIYDDGTDLVTLVDYPKFNDLDKLHNQDSIDYWYSLYSSAQYDNLRDDFYRTWYAAVHYTDKEDAKNMVYADDRLYGPWITPQYAETVKKWLDNDTVPTGDSLIDFSQSAGTGAGGSSGDDKPKPYFSHPDHTYSIIKKAEGNASGKVWDEYTMDENAWIDACLNIVIPSGVQSIDTYGYFNNTQKNGTNITTYFLGGDITDASLNMYRKPHTTAADEPEVVPGAFSGYYKDYSDGAEKPYEKYDRGNDYIRSVTMTDVQYLPDMAFDSCERLEKVVLGAALEEIGELPFYNCTNLKEVIGNDYYIGENGLVFSTKEPGDGTYTLIECLPGRGDIVGSATVPDNADAADTSNVAKISQIEPRAFEDCDDIRIVDLSDTTIKTIPERCFALCDALDMVYLPDTTNSIKDQAFADDKSLTVSIPAVEVFIASDAFVHGPNAKREPNNGKVKFNTYPDSAAAEYARYYDIMLSDMEKLFTVWFNDYNGIPLIENPFYVHGGDVIAGDERPEEPTRDGYEFDKWVSNTGIPVDGRIYGDTIFTATYVAVAGSHDGKYYVDCLDGINGSRIGERLEVPAGEDATSLLPTPPVHEGYTFVKWVSDDAKKDYTKVESDMILTALYTPANSSGGSGGGGSSGGSSGGDNSGGGGSSNGSSNTDNTQKETKKYTVTVKNGTGSGTYDEGATVAITASAPEAGKVFSKWTTTDKEVNFVNAAMSATTFKMPAKDVTVTAEYVDSAATTTAVASPTSNTLPPGYGSGYGTDTNKKENDDSNAQVVVSKPGISNIDLATAKVNGSSDSFVIKVTETNEAEEKVRSALINRYGSIDDRIKYWACDISIYDETGKTKIEDTTGLTVDITLPIPDELRAYGGNAMVGAVADNALESLTPRFNEINGVPCVTFTATHFSPYTIYVDTQNLSASQMLDTTPKTGDPIHPKWFLSIGLAAVSVLLFMKRDKKNNSVLKTA